MTGDCESRGQPANVGLPGKWPLKWCAYSIIDRPGGILFGLHLGNFGQ